MNNIHFAQKLKKARSDLAITQQQLADKLHVSRKTVSGWETGRTRPDIDMLRQMADIYHISLDELVSDAKAPDRMGVQNPYAVLNRITTTTLDIILAILIVQRLTHNTLYDAVFTMMDSLIYIGVGLRLVATRWGFKLIHSVRSPIFVASYFLFAAFGIYGAVADLFRMELAFQITLGIVGIVGVINCMVIVLFKSRPNE